MKRRPDAARPEAQPGAKPDGQPGAKPEGQPGAPPGDAHHPRLERAAFPVLAAGTILLFAALLCVTWLKWSDPVVDTGRELEIPWKVAQGKLLYKNMAYNYGPLSPVLNAFFLEVFGVRILSIVLCGILSAAAGMLLVYRICRFFLGPLPSCSMVIVFLFESVFQHYYLNGNFNFILPYSFPAVHGILAAMTALLFLLFHLQRYSRPALAAAGFFLGVCFLCKIEVAGAALVTVGVLSLLRSLDKERGVKAAARIRTVGLDTLTWAAPLVVVVCLVLFPYVAGSSFRQVVWENIFRPQLVDFSANLFFQEHLGVADLEQNLARILKSLGLWALVVGIVGAGASFLGTGRDPGVARPAGAGKGPSPVPAVIAVTGALACAWFFLPYDIEFSCLPAVCIVAGAGALLGRWFRKNSPGFPDQAVLALALFALLCLFRIFFTAGTFHYGFYLALPGVLLFAVFLVKILPAWIPYLRSHPRCYTFAMVFILVMLSLRSFLFVSLEMYRAKTMALSGPGGRMMVHPLPFGADLQVALEQLREQTTPEQTLLVLPEGATVNFLTGLENPTYYNLFIPPELNPPGIEARVIDEIEEHAVDWIMVIGRPVLEYGYRGLGMDYGTALMAYIKDHYEKEIAVGPPLFEGPPGGCVIYRRR